MGQALEGADAVHRMKPGRKPKVVMEVFPAVVDNRAQAYAMRVWAGQSVDVPPAERKERVFNALRGQNLSTDGIIFP